MNDFDYDCAQKKRIARGAFNRKSTTNRKGCRLPHENLTKKELEKLNGKVTTVSMTRPMEWEFFKTLSKDLQQEYLNTQVRRFGVGLTTIGRELFELEGSDSMLANYVRDHDLDIISAPPGRQPKAARDSWLRWLKPEPTIAPEIKAAEDFPLAEPLTIPAPVKDEVKPFRAHDYPDNYHGVRLFEEALKEAGLERDGGDDRSADAGKTYPTEALNLTLKGTPVEVLATLFSMLPTVLDEDRKYRFQISVDKFTLSNRGGEL